MEAVRYAFFDVDETIINCKSMFDFLEFWLCKRKKVFSFLGKLKFSLFMRKVNRLAKQKKRELVNAYYYQQFSGVSEAELIEAGKAWWEQKSQNNDIFNQSVLSVLKIHQRNGVKVVTVSGSMKYCLKPALKALGIQEYIFSEPEVINGRLTGKLISPPTIGLEKAKKIESYLAHEIKEVDLENSFAYGDHESDIYFMDLVGNRFFVKPSKEFEGCQSKVFTGHIIFNS
jgi:HAD superfamily hydrolase (TIGR01490 family)